MRLRTASLCLAIVACSGSSESISPPPTPVEDGGITDDAGPIPSSDAGTSDAAAPIVAPDDAWSWVDFPTSKCGSGTATGIGVNPHAGATELVIFMQGGGACSTGDSCWGASPAATYMNGFGATEFAQQPTLNLPMLNRKLAQNPVANASFVFVPYCTGDLHGGRAVVDLDVNGTKKTTYFYGGFDLDLFLARLVPTFPSLTRVILTGVSAGGFGSFVAYDKTVRAFGGIRVDIIDDSGPPIAPAVGEGASPVWNLDKPVECPSCASLRDIYDADRKQQPNSRFGLLTFNRDSTIAPRFGYTVDAFPQVITSFTTSIASDHNAAVFRVDLTAPDADHVVQGKLAYATSYLPWMTKLLNDDPTWTNQTLTP